MVFRNRNRNIKIIQARSQHEGRPFRARPEVAKKKTRAATDAVEPWQCSCTVGSGHGVYCGWRTRQFVRQRCCNFLCLRCVRGWSETRIRFSSSVRNKFLGSQIALLNLSQAAGSVDGLGSTGKCSPTQRVDCFERMLASTSFLEGKNLAPPICVGIARRISR